MKSLLKNMSTIYFLVSKGRINQSVYISDRYSYDSCNEV